MAIDNQISLECSYNAVAQAHSAQMSLLWSQMQHVQVIEAGILGAWYFALTGGSGVQKDMPALGNLPSLILLLGNVLLLYLFFIVRRHSTILAGYREFLRPHWPNDSDSNKNRLRGHELAQFGPLSLVTAFLVV
jgi:hypothetical protein